MGQMAFLDKLGEFAKNAADKANDGLEINRINSDITVQKGNISAYQRELGLYYWDKFVAGEILEQPAMDICQKIILAQENIVSLESEIEKIKIDRQIEKEERAQQKKAEKEQQKLAEQEETPAFCQNCGMALTKGQKFCGNCGNTVIK